MIKHVNDGRFHGRWNGGGEINVPCVFSSIKKICECTAGLKFGKIKAKYVQLYKIQFLNCWNYSPNIFTNASKFSYQKIQFLIPSSTCFLNNFMWVLFRNFGFYFTFYKVNLGFVWRCVGIRLPDDSPARKNWKLKMVKYDFSSCCY